MAEATLSDACFSIGVANRTAGPYTSWTSELRERTSALASRILALFGSLGSFDKLLKNVDFGFRVHQYHTGESSSTHTAVKHTRGAIALVKILDGFSMITSAVHNLARVILHGGNFPENAPPLLLNARLWAEPNKNPEKANYFEKITNKAQHRIACVTSALSVASSALYTTAFFSKGVNFARGFCGEIKSGWHKFSQIYPKVFFGLHIVSIPKIISQMWLASSTNASELSRTHRIKEDGTRLLGEDNKEVLITPEEKRKQQITYWRDMVAHVVEFVKNIFEFIGDAALFTPISPVVKLVNLGGVAISDFIGIWLKAM
ncbi:MAG: hypothetical protein S4CHLAM45_12790 [Chlamydiales bacterium]|nr:hypothetical protein [Chlamydiales bacterium]MCH9619768.1 hypothetical protein [Chlamydiales bacterium]MCH9623374.1 hypothetical protein [Chlamydiales bacterium]